MALTKCPHCGHTVLSVASQCPACFGMLGTTFLDLGHEGELAECRSCGHPVRSRTAVCPHCEKERPAGRPLAVRAAVPVAVVFLGVLAAALRQPTFGPTPAATATRMASALPAVQPVVARPVHAAPPPLPDSPRDASAPADSAGAADSPLAAVSDADEATPLQTRWVADWSNVRRAPDNEAPVMRVLAPGTQVRGIPAGWGWWSIRLGGDSTGYIAGALLRSSRPARSP